MNSEFDRYAGDYDALLKDPIRDRFAQGASFFHLRKWLLLRDFLSRQRLRPESLAWLDVGCGKGELLRFGGGSFGRAVGCDPSEEMLRECAGLQVEHQSNPTGLPFGEHSFDLITAVCVYHHLTAIERRELTREACRVLRPGGIFAIFEHNPWNPATRLIVSRTPVDANAVLLTAGETRRIMRGAGLKPQTTSYYLYFPESLFSKVGGFEKYLTAIPAGGQYAVCSHGRASGFCRVFQSRPGTCGLEAGKD
jgi:SAM-dependent methyltransferase